MAILKQSTAYTRLFVMVATSDHITGLTGATPVVLLSKAGALAATAGGTVTEVTGGQGWYKIALTTADTGTLGDLAFHATAASGDPTDWVDQVGDINANITTWLGTAVTAATAGIPDVNVKNMNNVAATNITTINANIGLATAGTITTLTNLPAMPTNWATALGFAASSLNGKGDWNTTTPPTAAAIATTIWTDSSAPDFATANSIGKSLYNAFAANTSVYTTASLANAPSGGLTAAQVASAVWTDATAPDFAAANSIGKSIYNAFTTNTSVYSTASLANAPSGGLTGAQIASAVWTDTTATDFSTVNSIGKALYTTAAPGVSGGLFIAGTNAATTVNITGSISTAGSVAGLTVANLDVAVSSRATASAMPTNFSSMTISAAGNVGADTVMINSSTTAASNLNKTTLAIARGTVTTGSASTASSIVIVTATGFLPTGASTVTSQFVGRTMLFDANTSTVGLRGQASNITANTTGGSNPIQFTVTLLTTDPALGDTFSIV